MNFSLRHTHVERRLRLALLNKIYYRITKRRLNSTPSTVDFITSADKTKNKKILISLKHLGNPFENESAIL